MIQKFTNGFQFLGDPNKFLAPNHAKKNAISVMVGQPEDDDVTSIDDDASVTMHRGQKSRRLSESSKQLLTNSKTSSNIENDFKYETDAEVGKSRRLKEDLDKHTLTM